jgi:hypothetical protein
MSRDWRGTQLVHCCSVRSLVLCLLLATSGAARAEVRGTLSLHGTARTYNHSFGEPEDHDGFGPGLAVQLLRAHPDYAHGLFVAWHTYREGTGARFQIVQAHYFIERRFEAGALGAGIGLDYAHARHYSSDGAYSYSDSDTMLAVNVQLAIDLVTFESGDKLGFVAGFGVFPLLDVLPVLTNGEVDVGWRAFTGSAGVFWQH